MINKTYESIKRFIKEYYKTLIIYAAIFCILTTHLPYYISSPGGLINTMDKVTTNDNFKLKGSLNMAYVSEMHATIPTFIFSYLAKDWDRVKEKDTVAGSESIKDMEYRNHMLLNESNKIAELVAYKNSNIDYEIKNDKIYNTIWNIKQFLSITKVYKSTKNSRSSQYSKLQYSYSYITFRRMDINGKS